jgi:hypothetical protein
VSERKELDLSQFVGGSDTRYRYPLVPGIVYTSGVKYVVDTFGAGWLIDKIATNQLEPRIRREEFQSWKLKVTGDKAVLTCDDGDGNVVHRENVTFTDFPEPGITIWYNSLTKVIYLPVEH